MKDIRKIVSRVNVLQGDLNRFGLDLTSERDIRKFDVVLKSFLIDMCELINELNEEPKICPVCGSDKTYLTIAHYCNRCAETTEF